MRHYFTSPRDEASLRMYYIDGHRMAFIAGRWICPGGRDYRYAIGSLHFRFISYRTLARASIWPGFTRRGAIYGTHHFGDLTLSFLGDALVVRCRFSSRARISLATTDGRPLRSPKRSFYRPVLLTSSPRSRVDTSSGRDCGDD